MSFPSVVSTAKRVLFIPVGSANVLVVALGAVMGAITTALTYASGDAALKPLTLTGAVLMTVSVAYTVFSPYIRWTEQDVKRDKLGRAGVARPKNLLKNHPHRLEAYDLLASELGIPDPTKSSNEAFNSASTLFLSGELETNEVPLAAAAIRSGAVTKDEIINAIQAIRHQSSPSLAGGFL